MNSKKKILFIIGSPNQTMQMYQIYGYLKDDFDCYFTQFFPGRWYEKIPLDLKMLEHTIMSGQFREKGETFVREHGLQYDYAGKTLGNTYDLVFMCTDIIYPAFCSKTKTVFVQEGMIDPMTPWARFVKKTKMPAALALRTSLNGCLNRADIYCAASEGYKNYFAENGTDPSRIVATGMPNFDNAAQYLDNDFPEKDYVLVCTSDIRETFHKENRIEFIKKCVEIAAGRPLFFKLHPNEVWERAHYEIINNTPEGTRVFQKENTNHMIANCNVLITQFSTVVYIGMALGKECYSYFDMEHLKKWMPIQNNGTSAQAIAEIGRGYINFKGTGTEYLRTIETIAVNS